MFIISLLLFIAGIVSFGLAFSVSDPWHAVVFVAGIFLVALAMGIPIHVSRRRSSIGK